MRLPSLNATNAKHFSYHRIWGLRYHKTPPSINLSSHFSDWERHPEQFQQILQKQSKIDGYYFKFFYWLFNIADYASDSHKMTAYYLFKEKMKALNQESTDIILVNLNKNPQLQAEISVPLQYLKDHLTVNWKVEGCLLALGFSAERVKELVVNGKKIAWAEIKETYRAQLLQKHTDKGGSNADFILLKLAFDALSSFRLENTTNDKSYDRFFEEMQKRWAQEIIDLTKSYEEQERKNELQARKNELRAKKNEELEKKIEEDSEAIEAQKQTIRQHIKAFLVSSRYDPIAAREFFVLLGDPIPRNRFSHDYFFKKTDEPPVRDDSTELVSNKLNRPLLLLKFGQT